MESKFGVGQLDFFNASTLSTFRGSLGVLALLSTWSGPFLGYF